MASLNKVILIGRLTNEPEVRYTSSGLTIASFTVAVDRPFGRGENGEKKTDFFRCKAWRQKAEFVKEYVGKGRLVCVEGRIELNDYVGQDGQKRYMTEIVADQIETLDSARDRPGDAVPSAPQGAPQGRSRQQDDGGSQGYDDNGYFADDAPAPAPARQPAQRAAAQPSRQPAPQRTQPRPAPQPAYPEDDFDDSDPFADE